jgi:geranylgeranyl diphosphate synthase type I
MMNLNDCVTAFAPAIEAELERVVDRTVRPGYDELRLMLRYHLGWEGEGAGPEARGKRIRPLLVLLCAEAAGGAWRSALPAAAAVELLHNFSLIHDDIQDHSPLRRGRPTIWAKWGIPQAINAGDVMYTQAYSALQGLRETVSAEAALEAHGILEDTCMRLTEGQYLDMAYETRRDLPADAYWPMISGKTSALLGCCAELGALCAGVQDSRRDAFKQYGIALGLAFQVLDDWLGIWGDTQATGKSVESDLVSGKKTLPVVYALGRKGEFARRWLSGPVEPADVNAVVKLLEDAGAGEYTLAQASDLTAKAQEALRTAMPDEDRTGVLIELTAALLKRNK